MDMDPVTFDSRHGHRTERLISAHAHINNVERGGQNGFNLIQHPRKQKSVEWLLKQSLNVFKLIQL